VANKTPLASWLYKDGMALKPCFREYHWPDKYCVEVFDFSTTLNWNNMNFIGRGVDENREIALEKSVSEAIERLVAKNVSTPSFYVDGFSISGNEIRSEHARFEALERFYLKSHLLQKFKFKKIDDIKLKKIESAKDVSFYRMATPAKYYGIVCAMVTANGKIALGFSLSESSEESVKKSWLEALPNFAWLSDGVQDEQIRPWHVSNEFLNQIIPLFSSNLKLNDCDKASEPELVEIEVPFSQIAVLKSAPLSAARYLILKG
jgi:hypothetical protein